MANFDQHTFCARCRDKNKGTDPCVENKGQECKFCLALTPQQSDFKASDSSATDSKIAELDLKWSERFNRLEALLLAKTLQQPTFSSDIKVNPPRSPPASIPRDSEPFFQPTGRTGKDSSAEMHQSASQPEPDINTGIGYSASLHQPASQLDIDRTSARSSSPKCPGKGSSAS